MTTEEEEIIRDDSAAVLFRTMEDGTFLDAVGVEVRRAIVELRKKSERESRKAKGVITIKVELAVDSKGVLESEGDITVKLPKSKRQRSIHWTDADGDIVNRRAERQLELKPVPPKGDVAPADKPKEPKAATAVKGM